jgi:hypothetical protein
VTSTRAASVFAGFLSPRTGERLIWVDAETVRILKEHRTARLMAGSPGKTTT